MSRLRWDSAMETALLDMNRDGRTGACIARALSEVFGVEVQSSQIYPVLRRLGVAKKPSIKRQAVITSDRNRRIAKASGQSRPMVLRRDHPAVREGRSLFPKSVSEPLPQDNILKSGAMQRKIGKIIRKGRWRGMPVHTLTLEERATCPRSCHHWRDCYGNHMHLAHRHAHGSQFEVLLENELDLLDQFHPHGFAVRLHVLGDFYSEAYVNLWLDWLNQFPNLHVFGFTAWLKGTPIGDLIASEAERNWDRFAIRQSNDPGGMRNTLSINDGDDPGPDAIICPAQTGATDCCATCGLCWQTQRPIAFITH